MIGEEGLQQAIADKGFHPGDEDAEFVVIGIDRAITYEKFALACLAVRNGATLISTNADIAIPTERGFMPGNGALTSVISVSTGVKPIFIGKPESIIMEQALKVIGTKKEFTLMIGDNYDTDIMAGMNAGLETLLVHTGITTKETLKEYDRKPTHVVDSLAHWNFETKSTHFRNACFSTPYYSTFSIRWASLLEAAAAMAPTMSSKKV